MPNEQLGALARTGILNEPTLLEEIKGVNSRCVGLGDEVTVELLS
jgi:hypothetical protein